MEEHAAPVNTENVLVPDSAKKPPFNGKESKSEVSEKPALFVEVPDSANKTPLNSTGSKSQVSALAAWFAEISP
ncbi:hypothetical protein ROHU_032021 [Labeo rohita]|uniref:Uncharacterized protein n=1 Tax=Labeo rohita TaxID=84645 RepID=A0A498LIF4_LABRO|nr:hypothetical protein ROHU_032021 [Labeo rohita]